MDMFFFVFLCDGRGEKQGWTPRGKTGCPAPSHGSDQNCGAFTGQNENHTLNSINGDDDYIDDYEC